MATIRELMKKTEVVIPTNEKGEIRLKRKDERPLSILAGVSIAIVICVSLLLTANAYKTLSIATFILGFFAFISGLVQIKNHKDDPHKNPLGRAVIYLIGGSFLLFTSTMMKNVMLVLN